MPKEKTPKKNNSSVLEKLQKCPELVCKRLGFLLMTRKSQAIKHLPGQEELVSEVFRKCAWLLVMLLKSQTFRKKIISMPGSPRKNKWTTFLDNLNICQDHNIQSTVLLRTLLQELISRERGYRPFWTPAYRELSEKLWSRIETGLAVSDSTLSSSLSTKQVEKLPFLEISRQKPANKNSQTTLSPLSMSLVADNWEEEAIKKTNHKTIQVQIFPTDLQKIHLKKAFDVSRYVKNMTLEYIKHKKFKHDWKELRNILVTEDTKTTSEPYLFFTNMIKNMAIYKASLVKIGNSEKDLELLEEQIRSIKGSKKLALKDTGSQKTSVKDFELEIHKDIRTCAVRQVCENKKTCETLFYNGEIKWYDMKFKKKNDPSHDLGLTTNNIKFANSEILISLGSVQGFRGFDKYSISTKNKKKLKGLEIIHQVRMTYKKNRYILHIPVSIDKKPIEETKIVNFCGVDPGCRTFLTTYGNKGITEYTHDYRFLEALQNKIIFLKSKKLKELRKEKNLLSPKNKKLRGGVRKKKISKVEKKIESFINILHWSSINSLLQDNDIIYFGDIKSHGIVKNGKNKTLNRNINGLKFYLYKQRLKFKAIRAGKRVVFVNEYLTTQGCSKCGNLWKDIGASKTYYCQDNKCQAVFDRDVNSAKNICMKGFLRGL